jgi:hypothetical protein
MNAGRLILVLLGLLQEEDFKIVRPLRGSVVEPEREPQGAKLLAEAGTRVSATGAY